MASMITVLPINDATAVDRAHNTLNATLAQK